MNYLVTFHTHYGAICFQKYCEKESIKAKMMSVPRTLSASCGVCILIEATEIPRLAAHEDIDKCYEVNGKNDYVLIESGV